MEFSRSNFVKASMIYAASNLNSNLFSQLSQHKKIILRSSWQTINIGDIGHTPGVLSLLEKYLPNVEVFLWPSNVGNGVEEMLLRRFPKLRVIKSKQDLHSAFVECDFLLHGSGASFVAEKHVLRWVEQTGKPFGVYGITFPLQRSWKTSPIPKEKLNSAVDLLSKAEFVYFRDSVSLEVAKTLGCKAKRMEFGPDGAFACDLKNEAKAKSFLNENNLKEGEFVCCIPRLRYTPSWEIPGKNTPLDPIRHQRNQEMKEQDHLPLRKAIEKIIMQTPYKVLICPEDSTQVDLGKEMLYDKLPTHIKDRVVLRKKYWLTDEALSVYQKSLGLFGHELHSAIMCVGHGIPAAISRWKEQTSKGLMWKDIGMSKWLFDMDDKKDYNRLPDTILEMVQNQTASRKLVLAAKAKVESLQKTSMGRLSDFLS